MHEAQLISYLKVKNKLNAKLVCS
ncbi:MAG: hypothetical protein ACE5KE_10755 [Methanosarcinales archaeon]